VLRPTGANRLGLRREAQRHAAFVRAGRVEFVGNPRPCDSGVAAALCHRSPRRGRVGESGKKCGNLTPFAAGKGLPALPAVAELTQPKTNLQKRKTKNNQINENQYENKNSNPDIRSNHCLVIHFYGGANVWGQSYFSKYDEAH
jgi:hypothetical protein